MPKRGFKLKVRIPKYRHPPNEWRREIYDAVLMEVKKKKIRYEPEDKLQLAVRLYFDDVKLTFVDVDNQLQHVMDAIQGLFGGLDKKPDKDAIIPNDAQIYKVVVEKGLPPPQSYWEKGKFFGHLTISKYTGPVYR